ncbi:MAG: type II toxin-antitoxin system RelE/ParE family toxin [Ignavibacteriae bacterium]|nr:type II toxin-antitoxin system RelE/ParE family toxin [Ignavibacteriota bacterium]
MDLKVTWTQFAENKLDDIFDYYISETDIPTAIKLVTGIIDKTTVLKDNPSLGQKEELLLDRPQNFRYLLFKKYKIIYYLNENKKRIEIVNVFDCRQNPIKMSEM